jgi:hypothetical protein
MESLYNTARWPGADAALLGRAMGPVHFAPAAALMRRAEDAPCARPPHPRPAPNAGAGTLLDAPGNARGRQLGPAPRPRAGGPAKAAPGRGLLPGAGIPVGRPAALRLPAARPAAHGAGVGGPGRPLYPAARRTGPGRGPVCRDAGSGCSSPMPTRPSPSAPGWPICSPACNARP